MSRQVIREGMAELSESAVHPPGRVRRPGGGRKKTAAQDPTLLRDLERLVEPVTRGNPESPLRWTCKSLRKLAEELRGDLEGLVEPVTRGNPESPLRWTCKSLRKLAEELRRKGHEASHQLVGRMLHDLGYSLQANSKTLEGTNHPDRNAQFEYLNRRVKRQLQQHQPVISVDTKKEGTGGRFQEQR